MGFHCIHLIHIITEIYGFFLYSNLKHSFLPISMGKPFLGFEDGINLIFKILDLGIFEFIVGI